MKTPGICFLDFSFEKQGYGRYKVTYTSPVTWKKWSTVITDMTIIDATLNAEVVKVKNLNRLKKLCKS